MSKRKSTVVNQFVKFVEREEYEKYETEDDLQAMLSIAGLQKVEYAFMRPHITQHLRTARSELAPKLSEWNHEFSEWKKARIDWVMRKRALLLLHSGAKTPSSDTFRPPPWKPIGNFVPTVEECVAMMKLALKEQHDAWAAHHFSEAGQRSTAKRLSRVDAGLMIANMLKAPSATAEAPSNARSSQPSLRSVRTRSVLTPVSESQGLRLNVEDAKSVEQAGV